MGRASGALHAPTYGIGAGKSEFSHMNSILTTNGTFKVP